VEDSITKDKVDNMYRDAFSPVIDPLIAYFYRTPATAAALKPLIGKDSALVRDTSFLHLSSWLLCNNRNTCTRVHFAGACSIV
jgi:hypothetical protein